MPGYRLNRRALLAGIPALPLAAGATRAVGTVPFRSDRIAVRAVGAGPDVIVIPGLGTGPTVWNGLVRALPAYRWHLVHVRGFAGLPAAGNRNGPLLVPVAREINRYATSAGLAAPAMIGHSMGGALALLAGLAPSAPARRLMVVDMLPAPAALVGGTQAGVGFLAEQLRGYFTMTVAGRRAFAALLRDAAPGAPASDPDVIAAALGELALLDLAPRLPALVPALTVVPAVPADPVLRATILAAYRAAYKSAPRARIRPIGPSGHMVMLDRPTDFAQAVRAMLGP